MKLVLILIGIVSLLELLLWTPLFWRWRRPVACGLIILLSPLSGLLAGDWFSLWTLLVVYFSCYRLINLLRVIEGRMQVDYLHKATRRTSYWLIGLQIIVLALAVAAHVRWSATDWLYCLAIIQAAVAVMLFSSTQRHLRTTKPPQISSVATRNLPSLSVLIPARNETDDLDACLQSLISSTYPKLEILVLDDCSQNKRTPQIIQSFAHAGVRFIAGAKPPKHWLAKNYAYDQLVEQANGQLLLFCGVDTRFEPETLQRMVEALHVKQKSVASWLPKNEFAHGRKLGSLFIQPSRYAWELSLPRRLLNRPPILSTCWLIDKTTLQAAGGFKAIARSHAPESYFARYAVRQQDGYSFLQSDEQVGLTSVKTFREQRDTAIRTRYPQLHRRPELVCLQILAELAALVAPFGLFVGSALAHKWPLAVLSAFNSLALIFFYSQIMALTYRRQLVSGFWLLPFAALYDIGLLNYSMWRYEFREVIWKGRNVCLPVMHVSPDPKATVTPNLE